MAVANLSKNHVRAEVRLDHLDDFCICARLLRAWRGSSAETPCYGAKIDCAKTSNVDRCVAGRSRVHWSYFSQGAGLAEDRFYEKRLAAANSVTQEVMGDPSMRLIAMGGT